MQASQSRAEQSGEEQTQSMQWVRERATEQSQSSGQDPSLVLAGGGGGMAESHFVRRQGACVERDGQLFRVVE